MRRFVLLNIPSDGQYTISAKGPSTSDPDFRLWRNGQFALQSTGANAGQESTAKRLSQGVYTLEIYDANNADDNSATGGQTCFSVTLN